MVEDMGDRGGHRGNGAAAEDPVCRGASEAWACSRRLNPLQ